MHTLAFTWHFPDPDYSLLSGDDKYLSGLFKALVDTKQLDFEEARPTPKSG